MISDGIHIGRRRGVRLGGAGGADADAAALIALMSVAPDSTRQGHINTLVTALKGAGCWAKLDELWIMAAHDAQAARLGWKRYKNLTAVNSPTFTVDQGFAGNGTTSYLDTNFVPSTNGVQYTLNDASFGVYSRTSYSAVSYEMDIACISTTFASENYLRAASVYGNVVCINGSHELSRLTVSPHTNGTGLFVARRTSSAAIASLRNGAVLGTRSDSPSVDRPNRAVFVGATNLFAQPTTRQYAAAFVGAAMSEAEQLALYNAIQAYMTAVGANV